MNGTVIVTCARSGQHRPGLLDAAEDVVPAPGVQRTRMLAQLVEDRVHLERRQHRLDQHRALDRAARQLELILGPGERLRPQPRLQMRLQLRQIEIRPRPALQLLPRVVEHDQPEVEQRPRHRPSVDQVMPLEQMPAPRPDHQRRDLLVQPVALLARVQLDRPPHRVVHVPLTVDDVRPRRRVRILEIRHEHPRTRIERVDHHLPLHRPRDLHPPIRQIRRRRRNTELLRRPDEHRRRRNPLEARRQQPLALRPELALQAVDERERVGRKRFERRRHGG